MPERHTGVNIADHLKEIVDSYEIPAVIAVTHNDAANMNKAVEVLNYVHDTP